ncbi:MAG TPA: hypothetical protein VE868_12325 [Balneolaceae bacterium]|nr:hypothetical protein [Balneolaceae bacterium]
MKKRLLLTFAFLSLFGLSAHAQSFHIEFNYQVFRPFIHFRLELGNRPRSYSPYQASYMRGYMDGVDGRYYDDDSYYGSLRLHRAYINGYRDGIRDRELLCRLRGVRRLHHRPFDYDDYYAPYYSIRIWLDQISFSFLRAPERRLPRHWGRRAHARLRHYRRRFKDDDHEWSHFEKRYHHHINHLKHIARHVRRRRRREGASRIGHHRRRHARDGRNERRLQRSDNHHKHEVHHEHHSRSRRAGHHRRQPKAKAEHHSHHAHPKEHRHHRRRSRQPVHHHHQAVKHHRSRSRSRHHHAAKRHHRKRSRSHHQRHHGHRSHGNGRGHRHH